MPSASLRRLRRLLWFTVLIAFPSANMRAAGVGLSVPEGFEVSLFADDDLAHNVFCMTIDAQGRVVVSGPGYVRILIDGDGDGQADTSRQFADGPKSGAQGMYFHGRDLLCIGDDGLIRYRDRDGDDRADGPPDVFLKMKTGGEHFTHAIRKGPDGWWYVIAGNFAEVDEKYATLPTTPVRKPHAGVILRLRPDLSSGELFAEGFRNAYDFAFHPLGDVFVYDSDGERDISLPWYRPTRVFQTTPASDAGWVTTSWKRPDEYADMPPVVASLGRGSPTGVECYRHQQFPEPYRDAVFVCDWTFGRVDALPLTRAGSVWSSEPIEFIRGVGEFGFAPTDVCVGSDGSLYVAVGGRGTRGSVFRVIYAGEEKQAEIAREEAGNDRLMECLDAPQPLSSWSRAKWMPEAAALGRGAFIAAAVDETLTPARRVRAIEILTELFGGFDAISARTLSFDESPEVRARAVWSLGRTEAARPAPALLLPFLKDADPLVARFALEALLGAAPNAEFGTLLAEVTNRLTDDERFVRQAAMRVVNRLPTERAREVIEFARVLGPRAMLSAALGQVIDAREVRLDALETALGLLESQPTPQWRFDAVRVMQKALGDVGGNGKVAAVFDGYVSRLDLSACERDLDPVRIRLANVYATGEPEVDYELARLLAMLTPCNQDLLDKVLAQIDPESHPVDDIHYLIVAARIPVERNSRQTEQTAEALVNLEAKIKARNLNQDSNWDERVGEMYEETVRHDPSLPVALARHPRFGRPGHVTYLRALPREHVQTAVEAFVENIRGDAEYPWVNEVIFVLGESRKPEHREMVREHYERFAARGAVTMVLAANPEERDRAIFLEGLSSSQLEVLTAAIGALEKLPPSRDAADQVALVRTLRRLGADRKEYQLRERVAKLLQRNTGEEFGFVFSREGYEPQPEVMAQWTAWVAETYPEAATRLSGGSESDVSSLREQLAAVDWDASDADRGARLFDTRSCGQCHGGSRALGPDLAGAAKRFSREDLFTAIALPNRDVSPRYQTTLIQTTAGQVHTGLVIYESVDGLILRTGQNQTIRVESDEIEERRILSSSLMPAGLLQGLRSEDLADLYAYLQSL